jgi:hypothetical protein
LGNFGENVCDFPKFRAAPKSKKFPGYSWVILGFFPDSRILIVSSKIAISPQSLFFLDQNQKVSSYRSKPEGNPNIFCFWVMVSIPGLHKPPN